MQNLPCMVGSTGNIPDYWAHSMHGLNDTVPPTTTHCGSVVVRVSLARWRECGIISAYIRLYSVSHAIENYNSTHATVLTL